MSNQERRVVTVEAGIEPSAEAGSDVRAPRPGSEFTSALVCASWAAVGAGTAAGLAVIVAESQADEFSGRLMALGIALVAVAAALGMVLGRLRLVPPGALATADGGGFKPGELSADAVTTMWFLGTVGMVAGGVSVFASTVGLASAALIAGGVVCVVIAAARRVPRGF